MLEQQMSLPRGRFLQLFFSNILSTNSHPDNAYSTLSLLGNHVLTSVMTISTTKKKMKAAYFLRFFNTVTYGHYWATTRKALDLIICISMITCNYLGIFILKFYTWFNIIFVKYQNNSTWLSFFPVARGAWQAGCDPYSNRYEQKTY